MAEFRVDQAAGLRRLFGQQQTQVVAFAAGSPGQGRSLAVANLAAVLARHGKEVLVLDENIASDDVMAHFGLRSRVDLDDVLTGEREMPEVVAQPLPGLNVVLVGRAVKRLGSLSRGQQQVLSRALQQLERPVDIILVDTAVQSAAGFSPLSLAAHETVVTLSTSGTAITEAYALIKRASQMQARRRFRVLINRVRNYPDACAVFDNLAAVARQKNVAHLEFAGAIPIDDCLRQAAQLGRPVIAVAPNSPAALALRDLANDLLRWQAGGSDAGGVQQFLQQLLHLSQRITPAAVRAG